MRRVAHAAPSVDPESVGRLLALALVERTRGGWRLTGRWHRTITFQTTPLTIDYSLPSTLLYRTRVLFNNRPLSPSSREELNNGRIHWRTETTTSGGSTTAPTCHRDL